MSTAPQAATLIHQEAKQQWTSPQSHPQGCVTLRKSQVPASTPRRCRQICPQRPGHSVRKPFSPQGKAALRHIDSCSHAVQHHYPVAAKRLTVSAADARLGYNMRNAHAATTVGAKAPKSISSARIAPSSNPSRRMAAPAGFGALAMTVKPPPVTAPATSAL